MPAYSADGLRVSRPAEIVESVLTRKSPLGGPSTMSAVRTGELMWIGDLGRFWQAFHIVRVGGFVRSTLPT